MAAKRAKPSGGIRGGDVGKGASPPAKSSIATRSASFEVDKVEKALLEVEQYKRKAEQADKDYVYKAHKEGSKILKTLQEKTGGAQDKYSIIAETTYAYFR